MPVLPRLASLWRNLFYKDQREQDLREEVNAYLDLLIERKIEQGMEPAEARRAALIELGGREQLKERVREVRMGQLLETIWLDLRFAIRILLKKPGFTLVAIITLALGIGANTAIFSVVNGVLLSPLPYKDSQRLVMILETKVPQFPEFSISPGNFLDWQKQNTVFERLVATRYSALNLTGTGDPERVDGLKVTQGFLSMLGAQPQMGRDFLPEEDQPGHSNVVIVSHGMWQRRFGGDANILQQTIALDGQSYTIIGVMPPNFQFFDRTTELWTTMAFTAQQAQNHGGHSLSAVGQLKSDVTLEQARAEMETIAERLAAQYPEVNTGWSVKLMPLLEFTVRRIKPALLVLLGAVAFVLLIACANVVNLQLARATSRQKEIAIRTALGAGRSRLIRQLLTESVVLSVAGGAVGILLAKLGTSLLLTMAPKELPRLDNVALDGRVLAFTAAITLLTGLIFGLIPALQASKPNLNETMNDAGRGSTEGGRRQLVRSVLVVTEVAAALVLLVGAGLMIKSFWNLQKVDPGFNTENALTVGVALPRGKYSEETQQVAFFQQLMEKVKNLPGVQAVGGAEPLPLSNNDFVLGFKIQGQPPLPPDARQSTNFYSVSADYFKAMGIPLRRGRLISENDTKTSQPVAVINETMARRIFPDDDPIGKQITFDTRAEKPQWFEIVGIVGDVKHYSLDQATTMQTYEPYTQQTLPSQTMVVRTTGEPTNLTAAIRRQVLDLDSEQPISSINTLDQLVATSIAQQRFSMLLLGVFAAVALILACVGIYGVLSYAVTQRTHEIGIRLALGAQGVDVMRMIVKRGMWLAGAGIISGVAAALVLAKLITSFAELLFEVKATDPMTFGVIVAILLVVALLACYIPARRAIKVDPMVALR